MENTPPPESSNQSSSLPAPEVLKPREDDGSPAPETTSSTTPLSKDGKKRRRTYRPSHKATFISFGVVALILAINVVVLTFVLKRQAKLNDQASNDQVTISQGVLDKLGVNRSSVGDAGVGLTIGPNTQFKNRVDVAGAVGISGELKINSKVSATDASLGQLQSGKTAVSELNVNGDSNASNLNLRGNLLVNGTTRLQGAVNITKLLTVYNSLNVSGNLAIGGTFSAHSLTSTGTLTIGGHVVTGGSTPGVSGSHLGSNGTISISGNDAAGSVFVGLGVGCGNGILATVSFHTQYSATPHVVVTPVGNIGTFYIGSRSANGFTIGINTPTSGCTGYAFDYIVEQ